MSLRRPFHALGLLTVGALVVGLAPGAPAAGRAVAPAVDASAAPLAAPPAAPLAAPPAEHPAVPDARPQLPHGGRAIFPGRILVAYYGTAQTPALGVLGEGSPAAMTRKLRRQAKPYGKGRPKVQIVYELIATIADASPGPDGDYSHFIPRREIKRYVGAARRHKALLVLDLQPGRSTFMSQARELKWALRKPWVGLALDPEWRMRRGQVPGQTIGSVKAAEVNKVAALVARVRKRHDLPQKLFMLHQFRTDMVRNIERVEQRPGLAMVQHVDGFGTQRQKRATYHAVARPARFHMGFKLFYDEDTDLFRPREVRRIRPKVQFVSYQ
jgi:hypothetical protein